MTRFGRPGRWKDIFGAATIALALLLLGIQAAPATEPPDSVEVDASAFECSEAENATAQAEIGSVRI